MTSLFMSRSFFTHLFVVALLVSAALALYGVKYQVKEMHEQVAGVQQQLLEERQALQVAAAEWAYLSRPDRLAQLSEKYLVASAPVGAQQVNDVQSLPYPQTQYVYAQADEVVPSAPGVMQVAHQMPRVED
jgi:hypothetical protein